MAGCNKNDHSVTAVFFAVERSLKTYLTRFLARWEDVEDTVQETFLRAWEAEKSCEIHAPRAFLFKVAKNLALTEITRKTNRCMVTLSDMEELGLLAAGAPLEETLETESLVASLGEGLRALPPRCRRVLILRKVYGYSHKEIAGRMDISVKTVEKHLSKALQHCQRLTSGREGDRETLGEARGADETGQSREALKVINQAVSR